MRNNIYRHCLADEEVPVQVTKDLKAPSLLSTCRQIRDEALLMWYCENTFEVRIIDCDAALYQAYMEHVITPLEHEFDLWWNCTIIISGEYNWAKLMQFCRGVWEGKVSPIDPDRRERFHGATVIAAATNIASEATTLPWEAVVRQLERLREVAGRLDEEWFD